MYLTKENLLTIEKYLKERGVKDLDFPVLKTLTGDEYVVVTNSQGNKRTKLETIVTLIEENITEDKLLGRLSRLEKGVGNTDSLIEDNTNLVELVNNNSSSINSVDQSTKQLSEKLLFLVGDNKDKSIEDIVNDILKDIEINPDLDLELILQQIETNRTNILNLDQRVKIAFVENNDDYIPDAAMFMSPRNKVEDIIITEENVIIGDNIEDALIIEEVQNEPSIILEEYDNVYIGNDDTNIVITEGNIEVTEDDGIILENENENITIEDPDAVIINDGETNIVIDNEEYTNIMVSE